MLKELKGNPSLYKKKKTGKISPHFLQIKNNLKFESQTYRVQQESTF